MARDDLHFRLRIPPEMKERIEAAAAANRRSMTAEIIHRLEESLEIDAAPRSGRSGYWVMPAGMTEDDVAGAIEDANRQAIALAFKRLGLAARPFENDTALTSKDDDK